LKSKLYYEKSPQGTLMSYAIETFDPEIFETIQNELETDRPSGDDRF
jgi:hypothetical protein